MKTLAVLLLIAGILVTGVSTTAFVISQSCCFPPHCEPEYVCSVAPRAESPLSPDIMNPWIGIALIVSSLVVLRFSSKHERLNSPPRS